MLVGVLCEVVRAVSATEQEKLTVMDVTYQLRSVMNQFSDCGAKLKPMATIAFGQAEDRPINTALSQSQFQKFLTNPNVSSIIREMGVDVDGLMEMSDVVYENAKKEGLPGIQFEDFIELVLNARGTNAVTIKDVNYQLRIMKGIMKDTTESLRETLMEQVAKLRQEINPSEEASVGRDVSAYLEDESGEAIPGAVSFNPGDIQETVD